MARSDLPVDDNPVARAIAHAGGIREVARRLQVSHQAVHKWRIRLPAERVLALEELAGFAVTRHELRPDLYPRDNQAA